MSGHAGPYFTCKSYRVEMNKVKIKLRENSEYIGCQ